MQGDGELCVVLDPVYKTNGNLRHGESGGGLLGPVCVNRAWHRWNHDWLCQLDAYLPEGALHRPCWRGLQ
jgi:hypothetical protein